MRCTFSVAFGIFKSAWPRPIQKRGSRIPEVLLESAQVRKLSSCKQEICEPVLLKLVCMLAPPSQSPKTTEGGGPTTEDVDGQQTAASVATKEDYDEFDTALLEESEEAEGDDDEADEDDRHESDDATSEVSAVYVCIDNDRDDGAGDDMTSEVSSVEQTVFKRPAALEPETVPVLKRPAAAVNLETVPVFKKPPAATAAPSTAASPVATFTTAAPTTEAPTTASKRSTSAAAPTTAAPTTAGKRSTSAMHVDKGLEKVEPVPAKKGPTEICFTRAGHEFKLSCEIRACRQRKSHLRPRESPDSPAILGP